MKIVILDGYTENPGDLSWEGFYQAGDVTVYDRTAPEQILERIGDAQAVITNKTPLSADTLAQCPQLKYIGVLATGYNVVDVQAARARAIPVCNIPSYGTQAVSQFAIGLLLEICHRIGHHSQAVHAGKWTQSPDFCFWDYPLIELQGKTMGIVGFGRIGHQTAVIARALGMDVIAYKPHPGEDDALVRYVTLEALYARSDVVMLHCPLFLQTEGMINRASLQQMKDGVIIINTSRGQLIVEQDLAEALNCGKVYAAGLDVVSSEPITADNPLLTAKNCFITPHIAWAPKESRQRLMDIAVENLHAFIAGDPQNVVN